MRRYIVDHALTDKVRFRNVDFDESAAKLKDRGGAEVPALWDGERLITGENEIIAALLFEL